MLQLKVALSRIWIGITGLQQRLTELITEHRETLMIGRTLLQQARPISFGFKVAGWLDQLIRCKCRLREVRAQALVLQFGGAVGTLASSGSDALAIMSSLARRLELGEPAMPWHTARDRFFEIGSALAMLAGCLGKIATDASLLMQTEVGELSEAAEEGRGGSSAMPHKKKNSRAHHDYRGLRPGAGTSGHGVRVHDAGTRKVGGAVACRMEPVASDCLPDWWRDQAY